MADSVNETKLLASPVHSGVAVLGETKDVPVVTRSVPDVTAIKLATG